MIYLCNQRIQLRALEPEDVDVIYTAENETSAWWVGEQTGPYSILSVRNYVLNANNDIYADRQLRLMAELKEDHTCVGIIDLFDFSPRHMRAEVGIIVFPEFQGQGYGNEMLQMLDEFCCSHLHFHQLYARTPVSNEYAVKLFRKNGYQTESLLKDWVSVPDGYMDALLLQKIF